MCFASKNVNRAVSSVLFMCIRTAFLIKYKIINLVHHLRPFTIFFNFKLYERQTGLEKKTKKNHIPQI